VAAQPVLSHIGHNKLRNSIEFLKSLNGFTKVFFLQKIKIELVVVFKNSVECLFQTLRSRRRIRQIATRLFQLGHCCYPDFVPIEIILLEPRECIIRRIKGGILQATTINHMLQNRSVRRRGYYLIFFFDELMKFRNQISSVFRGHFFSLQRWNQIGFK